MLPLSKSFYEPILEYPSASCYNISVANKFEFQKTEILVGDLVKVSQKIVEEGKERIGVFQGMVIGARGRGENKSFIVRRIGAGKVGIEKIFPVASPILTKIEVLKRNPVRRAKLYYLRKK